MKAAASVLLGYLPRSQRSDQGVNVQRLARTWPDHYQAADVQLHCKHLHPHQASRLPAAAARGPVGDAVQSQ